MLKTQENIIVLLNFLKSGMSTRELDGVLGHSSEKTKGWKSWEILKKYSLRNEDKGKLFLYSERQSKEIIRKLIRNPDNRIIDKLIIKNPPINLEKYRNAYVIADSEKSFYNIFSGETRNIIQSFFNPKKKLIGKCQFRGCTSKQVQLDTVHYGQERPAIFMRCASRSKRPERRMFRYDVYQTMKCFLKAHSRKGTICFLCKKHHNEFHRVEKLGKGELNKFRKNIMFQ